MKVMVKVFTCLCIVFCKVRFCVVCINSSSLRIFSSPAMFEWHSKPTVLDRVLPRRIFLLTSQANMVSCYLGPENISSVNNITPLFKTNNMYELYFIYANHTQWGNTETPLGHQCPQIKHNHHQKANEITYILFKTTLLPNER